MNQPDRAGKNLITPEGYKRHEDEIDQLWRQDRPKIVTEVMWAAAQGDRSENAEYIYGKKKLREIDKRLEFLQRRIKNALVIDPLKQSGALIDFGATVTVENEKGEKKIYFIVGEDEADPGKKRISWKSPIGAALMGKKAGDLVEVETPNGVLELRVKGFRYIGC